MAHIDTYLKRVFSDSNLSYLDDLYDLYDFVPNDNLRKLLASFHTQLNRWFTVINSDINIGYDDEGNAQYTGGYFHAQDSRDYLDLINTIDQLKSKLSSTEYAFKFCNDNYDDTVRRCRRFVVKSGGSTIPEGFTPIEIDDLTPVFQMTKNIAITQDKQTVYAELKTIGEGSYATVFRYDDPNYKIPIALKRAKPELDNKELLRFKTEFDVLKSLHSPYIVEVYSYDDLRKEYTMECMDENIYKFVTKNNDKLSLADRKKIIGQICRGLKYIHNRGLLHRDISLTNVFVKHYDDIDVFKIGDFGLVKLPESTLTSLQSELKGSLNDPDLVNAGFGNYEMCHETFALTRLCYFILTGRTNIDREKNETIKLFWNKGTSPVREERYQTIDELYSAVQKFS